MSDIKSHIKPLVTLVKSVKPELKLGTIYQALSQAFFSCKWESITALRDTKRLKMNNVIVLQEKLLEIGLDEPAIKSIITDSVPAIISWSLEEPEAFPAPNNVKKQLSKDAKAKAESEARAAYRETLDVIPESKGKDIQVLQRRRFAKFNKPEVK